jgi:hypothetical protein
MDRHPPEAPHGQAPLRPSLRSSLYGVTALDPLTLGTIPLVLLGVALLSSLLPAWRATQVSPMVALRDD